MTTTAAGPFVLVDPPTPEAEATIVAAIDAIGYPWPEDLGPIPVEWRADMVPNTASGLYYGSTNRIVLSARDHHQGPRAAFVFAHEVGHMLDDEVLTDAQRGELLDLMHRPPFVQLGHVNHDHPDVNHTAGHTRDADAWHNGEEPYVARVYEAFADLFVAAWAPAIWQGDPARGWGDHHPRFVHHSTDTATIRAITAPPPPAPEPAEEEPDTMTMPDIVGHARERVIRRAVRLGLMEPNRRGRFRPRRKVTRAELAEALVAAYDKARRQ